MGKFKRIIIPITEEILAQNSFIIRDTDAVLLKNGHSVRVTPIAQGYRVEVFVDDKEAGLFENRLEPIRYLNQLQDVYQLATGKELEIKL